MESQSASASVNPIRAVPPIARVARAVILAVAGIWFLILALPLGSGDPVLGLPDLLHGIAFGLALLIIGLIDWSTVRAATRGAFGVG